MTTAKLRLNSHPESQYFRKFKLLGLIQNSRPVKLEFVTSNIREGK